MSNTTESGGVREEAPDRIQSTNTSRSTLVTPLSQSTEGPVNSSTMVFNKD